MSIPNKLRDKEINFVLLERGGKKPFEKNWQKQQIKWDDVKLQNHISSKGNYGVLGGGEKKLLIVDFDNKQVQEEVIKKLPKTFTVKTGSGLLHKYFFSDVCNSFKIFDEDMNTLADIQGEGKQVVGAGSIHPNGNAYEIVENEDINFIDYSELKAIMMAHDKKPKKEIITKIKYEGMNNDLLSEIKSKVSMESLLSEFGIDTSHNPSTCLFHASKGGKCLGWTGEVAHCFHCNDAWNIFSLVQQHKKLSFSEALEWLCEREGLQDELEKSRKDWKRKKDLEAQPIKLLTDTKIQADKFNELQPYFYDRSGLWWLWNDKEYSWELVDEVDILNMISDSTETDVIKPGNRTIILNTMKQEGRKNIPKPAKPTWIQFKENVYDVETGEQFKASSKYFITNPIPWELEKEGCDTPIMDKIFAEWVGEEYVEVLYELLAYSILPDYPIHRIFCFIGGGMNGKSCFLNLLRKFIGTKNCCSTELDTLLQSRFEVTRLHKKLVCLMGETNFNEMNKTSLLKKLSGGDLIGYEYKNKNPFEEKNYAKIIIATNNLPSTSDKTIGFYRRWMIIDFPNRFDEKKNILDDIPEKEYKSLALRCCVTLKGLLEKRAFTKEGSIEERIKKYEAKSNFLEQFLKDFTIQDISKHITKADFYKKFVSWCKENRHREMAENSVGIAMKKLGIESSRKYFDWLYNGKGGQLRVWEGLKWRE